MQHDATASLKREGGTWGRCSLPNPSGAVCYSARMPPPFFCCTRFLPQRVLPAALPASGAELEQGMSQQPVGKALDHFFLQQALAPRCRNGARSEMRAGESPADGGHHIRIAAEVRGCQHSLAKISCARKDIGCSRESSRRTMAGHERTARYCSRRRYKCWRRCRCGRGCGCGWRCPRRHCYRRFCRRRADGRPDRFPRTSAERLVQGGSQCPASAENDRRLAGRSGRFRRVLRGDDGTPAEEVQRYRYDSRERLRILRLRVVCAREGLPPPLGERQRAAGRPRDAHTVAGRREVALLLPEAITIDLIARIEAFAFEEALGETQRHGGVVTPPAAWQLERSSAEHVAHRCEATRAAKLRGGGNRIADRKPKQRPLESPAQAAGRSERRRLEQRVMLHRT